MKILLFIKTLRKFNVTDRTLKFNLPSNLWENWNNIIYSILSKKRIFTCSIVEEIHSGKKKDYRFIFIITKIWDRKTWRKSTLIGPIELSLLFFQKFTCNKKFNFKKTLSKVFCIKVIKHRKKNQYYPHQVFWMFAFTVILQWNNSKLLVWFWIEQTFHETRFRGEGLQKDI